jgi:diketogulonate reductase-like aldo/keto reductase
MKKFKLNNAIDLPKIGFGTYKLNEGEECYNSVAFALKNNYRHIDTAAVYENEKSTGKAIRDSGIDRKDIFVTTKVWNTERGYEKTVNAFAESLNRLGLDYIDLYLIHWPANKKNFPNAKELNAETWRALEYLYKDGKVKSIGVSNFLVHHLEELLETAEIVPMVNQIEYHPGYLQQETVDFCQSHGILVEAWSPLGRGRVLDNPLLIRLAEKYNVSTGAICLQFALQQGICVLPKSATPDRIKSNNSFDFEFDEADISLIKEMPELGFSGLNPDEVDF